MPFWLNAQLIWQSTTETPLQIAMTAVFDFGLVCLRLCIRCIEFIFNSHQMHLSIDLVTFSFPVSRPDDAFLTTNPFISWAQTVSMFNQFEQKKKQSGKRSFVEKREKKNEFIRKIE